MNKSNVAASASLCMINSISLIAVIWGDHGLELVTVIVLVLVLLLVWKRWHLAAAAGAA